MKPLHCLVALVVLGCSTTTSNLSSAATPRDLPGYAKPYDQVFSAAVDAVSLLSWEVTVAQKDAGIISAKSGMSLTTYGDKITIRIFKGDAAQGDSLVHVGFSSGTNQAYDWGKGGRNQSKFYEKMDAALGKPANVKP